VNLTEPGELKEEPEPTVQLKEETDDDQPSVFELLEDNMKCDDMEKCDWVSHHHLRRWFNRPPELSTDEDRIEINQPVIVPPVELAVTVESREELGGSVPQSSRKETRLAPPTSDSPPSAARASPRKSSRPSIPPDCLIVADTNVKSYLYAKAILIDT